MAAFRRRLVLLLLSPALGAGGGGGGVKKALNSSLLQVELTTPGTTRNGGTAPSSPSLPTFCGGVSGPGLLRARAEQPDVHTLRLSCDSAGATIAKIEYASYGTFGCTWDGTNCRYADTLLHNWTTSTCTAANVLRLGNTSCSTQGIASSLFAPRCVGKPECSFDCSVDGKDFPKDPCVGVFKSIFVQASCSHGTGKVTVLGGGHGAAGPSHNMPFLSTLRINAGGSIPGAGFTRSLVDGNGAQGANRLSTTGIWASAPGSSDVVYHPATAGRVLASGATSVTVGGIRLGETATEQWKVSLTRSDTLRWEVTRSFQKAASVHDDWGVSLGLDADGATNAGFTASGQVPGWLDVGMELDRNSANAAGFRKLYPDRGGGKFQPYWYSLESNQSNQTITFSPSGMELATEATCTIDGQPCSTRFVFAQAIDMTPSISANCQNRTPAPGVPAKDCIPEPVVCPNGDQVNGGQTQIRIGLTSVAVRGQPTQVRKGTTMVVAWELKLRRANDVAPLQLQLPSDPELGRLSRRLAAQFSNPIAGWWAVTNSPASVTCLHELSWFPMAWSVLGQRPPSAAGQPSVPSIHDAFAKQLRYYGDVSHASPYTGASGYIQGRWGMSCPENFTSFGEANPNYILSAYYHAVNTGDKEYIKEIWGILQKTMDYITSPDGMNAGQTGIPYGKGTTGRKGEWVPANWYDEVNFGGWDSIVCVYAVQSMEALRRLSAWIGRDASETDHYQTLVNNARTAYNERFWDNEAGWYREWVDVDGLARSTGYLWPQYVAMSDLANVSSTAQRERTFSAIDSNYARLRKSYNVTQEQQWCTPDNLKPLNADDCHGGCSTWPGYESGRCFLWLTGWEIYARSRHNGGAHVDAAFMLWERLLGGRESNYTRFKTTAFWQQNNAWGDFEDREPHDGSDVLLDQIVTVWGFLRGTFGLEATLTGVEVVHPPAKQLEGASWTFVHLGKARTATVTNGTVVLS
jgi:hypothetical protein